MRYWLCLAVVGAGPSAQRVSQTSPGDFAAVVGKACWNRCTARSRRQRPARRGLEACPRTLLTRRNGLGTVRRIVYWNGFFMIFRRPLGLRALFDLPTWRLNEASA